MIDLVGKEFANYKLTRVIGKGGASVVYLGEHRYLGKERAIKVMKPLMNMADRQKFLQEASRLGKLTHRHIIQVEDAGIENNTPYLVMPYAPYGSLRQLFEEQLKRRQGWSLETILTYVVQIADALQYMHDQGILHQDVKPENMLLDQHNEVLLSDFGAYGYGTVGYMAPEQANGSPLPSSDQYALGVVVYEWLCGERPFSGSPDEVERQQLNDLQPPLVNRLPGFPTEVEQVVFTALASSPVCRYACIGDFAKAFEAVCVSLPPAALKTGFPVAASVSANNGILSRKTDVVGAPPSGMGSLHRNNTTPIGQMGQLVTQKRGALAFLYREHEASVKTLAWSPDGKSIASGSDDLTIRIWDALTGKRVSTCAGCIRYDRCVQSICWSPDGKQLVSADEDQRVCIWDTTNGTLLLEHREYVGKVKSLWADCAVAWSPDGAKIAFAGVAGEAMVWNAHSGHMIAIYKGHQRVVNALAWSPDSRYIATAGNDKTVQVWHAASGKHALTYDKHPGGVRAVIWSPRGGQIASGGDDRKVRIWRALTGDDVDIYEEHIKRVQALAWSPDGKQIASAGKDMSIRIWDAATAEYMFSCQEHKAAINALSWSPDGKYLASASVDETVCIWHVGL